MVKVAATAFSGAELGGGGGGGGVRVVSEGGLGEDAVAGGGGGLVVLAVGVADGGGEGEVAGDFGGGEVVAEGVGDGAIEGEGEGEVVGGDAGAELGEVEETETDSFWPPRQCWPKVQMKWWSSAEEMVKLAGETVRREMGLVVLHVSNASLVTLATSCCPETKLKTTKTKRKNIDQTLDNNNVTYLENLYINIQKVK